MFGGGPTRYREGGTRGGRDQFSWDTVKDDKFRDYYLGSTSKLAGEQWYEKTPATTAGASDEAKRREEIAAVREAEQLMARRAL